jgi:hypothetical protein
MIPRLELSGPELDRAVEILHRYLEDKSKIVKTMSLQALADLAEQDSNLVPQVIELLAEMTQTGSPAMKSRSRKLLAKLKSQSGMRVRPKF